MRLFRTAAARRPAPAPAPRPRPRPRLEELESRFAPATLTGDAWTNPQVVTLSFVPDGTLMSAGVGGNVYSDMFARFNARWSQDAWQDAILSAAQLWAQSANVNLVVVPDNGTPEGQGAYQQGDPGMGDIRIGSYDFGNNYLGVGYMPPPDNNFSIAGDINFNSRQTYNIGTTYDLQTVAMHEFGHALGLGHSSYGTVMYASYAGLKRSLSSDDVSGIRGIYGARQADGYEGLLGNNSFLTATTVAPLLNLLNQTALNADITTTSDADYFAVLAPLDTSSTVQVNVQSSGLSLLRPEVTVYAANHTVLTTATGTGDQGSTLSLTLNNVSPLQLFYVKVTGADNTAFSTGRYALSLNMGPGLLPAITSPIVQVLDGAVTQGGGGLPLLGELSALTTSLTHLLGSFRTSSVTADFYAPDEQSAALEDQQVVPAGVPVGSLPTGNASLAFFLSATTPSGAFTGGVLGPVGQGQLFGGGQQVGDLSPAGMGADQGVRLSYLPGGGGEEDSSDLQALDAAFAQMGHNDSPADGTPDGHHDSEGH